MIPNDAPDPQHGHEAHPPHEVAIETLVTDPAIYHSIDYWAASTGGHGQKFESGPKPTEPTIAANNMLSNWQAPCEKAAPFSAPTWHHGEGVVGKIAAPGYTGYVLYFQKVNGGDRPDVVEYTVVPADPKFAGVTEQIESNPQLLLSVFSRLAPDEAASFTDGVSLVSGEVVDLQPYAAKPKQENTSTPSVPLPHYGATRRSGFLRRLLDR